MLKAIICILIVFILLDYLVCKIINKWLEVERAKLRILEETNKSLDFISGFLEEIRDKLND